MGSCCVQKEKDQEFAFEESSLTIANGRAFPTLSLLFSQQRPSKLKGECAIVFLSTAIDTDDCKMFAELHSPERNSLNQTIKRLAETKPFVVGEFLLTENSISRLKVGYLMMVCLPVWKGSAANKQIEEAIKVAFKEVDRMKFKAIVVCEPNSSLGVPNNVVGKILLRTISEIPGELTQVTFLLSNEANQTYYHSLAGRFPDDKDASSVHSDY